MHVHCGTGKGYFIHNTDKSFTELLINWGDCEIGNRQGQKEAIVLVLLRKDICSFFF